MSNHQQMTSNQTQPPAEEFLAASFSLFIAGPISTIVYIIILLIDSSLAHKEMNSAIMMMSIFMYIPVGLLIPATYSFIVGIPILVIGWRLNLVRWWSSIIMGFLLGFPLPILFTLRMANTPVDRQVWADSLMLGLASAISGLAFWLIWRFLSKFKLYR